LRRPRTMRHPRASVAFEVAHASPEKDSDGSEHGQSADRTLSRRSSALGAGRLLLFVGGERMTGAGHDALRQRYEICVRGHLGETVRSAFPALRAQTRGDDTILAGVFADQAALYGVLAQFEALGLELIDVRRLPLT
jgi:hypothetical protein